MLAKPHQIKFADACWDILKQKGYVYLSGKPRSGKTLTAILVAEKSSRNLRVLVLTKKNAISGWTKFITSDLKQTYHVTNYEAIGKWDTVKRKAVLKLNPSDYDLVILDESHNLGTLGKPSGRIKTVKALCYDLPHINLSGTPIVESPNSIFHQMFISKYSPFKYVNFYKFFAEYGRPYTIKAAGRDIQQYDRYKPKLLEEINKFTVYMTQEDAGISKDMQATDAIHYVTLKDSTKALYNKLMKDKVIELTLDSDLGESVTIVGDSTMKLRMALHMLESGVVKDSYLEGNDAYIDIGNSEKIDYIYNTFGDTEDVGIMAHFIGERVKLKNKFKRAQIYSSTSHAEGVDLSHLKHFVILSSDYRGSKFIQRRERIVNMSGTASTTVNHIVVKGAISEQVYNSVSKKMDFNNKVFEQTLIT